MIRWPNHGEAWRQWRAAMIGSRMHHAWLLAGKSGLGKHDFALAAARELVAEPGVPQPGDHPDIHIVTYSAKDEKEERKQQAGNPYDLSKVIRERDIGAMQARLRTRPTLGQRRAIIIEPADDMNSHAANKLLKSLEEPPVGTFFLLVTHRPARLLPTIRSRCRTLRFPVLEDDQLALLLEDEGVPPDPGAIAASEGSFGAALRYAAQDLAPVARAITALISGADNGIARRGELARLIGPRAGRERLQAVLDLAQALVARAARESDDDRKCVRLINAHAALVALASEAPTANFDPGMLPYEIGSLLVAAAPASEPAHG
jgi:DNA polymerase-3 subunit delta'